MKHKNIYLLFIMLGATATVQAQLYVEKNTLDKVLLAEGQNIFFSAKSGESDTWSIGTESLYRPTFDLSYLSRIYIPQSEAEEQLAAYTSPAYADDYRTLASWDNHEQWNLANVHDPTVFKAADGYYYMYQTDASYGNAHTTAGGHFMGRRSKDLVNWEYVGCPMQNLPSWIQDSIASYRSKLGLGTSSINFSDEWSFGYWAPCARKINDNLYRMYYSIVMPNSTIDATTSVGEPSFIGMMESTNPADSSSWVDRGYVTTQYTDRGTSWAGRSQWGGYYYYNAIDPSYIITPEGEHWLIYGSWHSGIAALQLDPSTGKYIGGAQGDPWTAPKTNYGKRIFTRYNGSSTSARWQPSEGPEVVYRDGYYYLFLAFDDLSHKYNTRVLRSTKIDGPYVDMRGVDYTYGTSTGDTYPIVTHPYRFGSDAGWVGISHCAIFDDGEGNWYYASQQRYPDSKGGNAPNAVMLGGVRRILWTADGWPVVLPERYGNVPQAPIAEEELVGRWQQVQFSYAKTTPDANYTPTASVDLTLNADHTITGDVFDGEKWSYDAEAGTITLGSYPGIMLTREVDWEANPRHATIVYAGYNSTGTATFWGKKVANLSADGNAASSSEETVGAADNTAGFWSAFSKYLNSSSSNCEFHYSFVNYTNGTANWNNWILAVTNGEERNTANYKEYVVLRADNYAWQGMLNTISDAGWFTSLTSDYNWSTFTTDMNGATVDLTVKIDNGVLTATALTTTTAGATYTMTFVMPIEEGMKGTFLTCEGAHLEISEQTVTDY